MAKTKVLTLETALNWAVSGSKAVALATNEILVGVTGGDIVAKALSASVAADVVADPGDAAAIPVTNSAIIAMTSGASGETGTLAIPTFAGQRLILTLDVDGGGDRVVTAAAAVNTTGNNTLTFGDAGDFLELVGVQVAGALVWRISANDGVGLTTV
jgi:hypothetical protein